MKSSLHSWHRLPFCQFCSLCALRRCDYVEFSSRINFCSLSSLRCAMGTINLPIWCSCMYKWYFTVRVVACWAYRLRREVHTEAGFIRIAELVHSAWILWSWMLMNLLRWTSRAQSVICQNEFYALLLASTLITFSLPREIIISWKSFLTSIWVFAKSEFTYFHSSNLYYFEIYIVCVLTSLTKLTPVQSNASIVCAYAVACKRYIHTVFKSLCRGINHSQNMFTSFNN